MKSKYQTSLQKLFEIQDRINNIHPLLKKVYPIAIVEENYFLIFDTDSSGKKYVFIKKSFTPESLPKRITAAFPLECYGNKTACIITGEIVGTLEGYVTIFHEFVHCYQCEICEQKLKQTLQIAQRAMVKKEYSWELNYPFAYNDNKFIERYSLFLNALKEIKLNEIFQIRNQLRQILGKDDFEYMVWQEWKEGFARFIENHIRIRLGLKENFYGIEKPYHRITFYQGGAWFIEFLGKYEPELLLNIERLFHKMLTFGQ